MTITVQIQESVAHISMADNFDFKVHREFKSAYMPLLDNAAVREIEIDLRNVNFIDSSALGMLMLLNERAKAVNKTVSLASATDAVSRMLEVANFSKIFNIKA